MKSSPIFFQRFTFALEVLGRGVCEPFSKRSLLWRDSHDTHLCVFAKTAYSGSQNPSLDADGGMWLRL